mmetsp:Transcript_7040/g.8476  ORF Transcript_7040/g.8476 Transcript_7040/m.8476 type:complete len:231 (-) Transcript_7040:133-825(-)|eukprot:CAMPEP_0170465408 /NCGR_PEP_ID=MMETSP0123-20130129/9760_1 /TAXON_ID=182087 /ORGANISM="Favella ehrenbergii, Strain Fehren 1" /LENGTH=230 /DNA_ID=CAMNT_0010731291 /DNA_START=185 /DNA_END=877 /DNA_ORIENTATION=+
MAEYRTLFDTADANSDGRLDFAELKAFIRANYDFRVSNGIPAQDSAIKMTDEQLGGFYQLLNAATHEVEGISFEEFFDFNFKIDDAYSAIERASANLPNISEFTQGVAQREHEWFQTLSQEQKDTHTASHGPEAMPARMAEFEATFAAADANGDGRLDKAEMMDYLVKSYQARVAAGIPSRDASTMPPEMIDTFYEKMNSISEGEGIAKVDWMVWGAMFNEMIKGMRAQQ